ncbi:hypothetical protein C7H19_18330 [Aphanothece hegewaldii CCALA 016]|uniref:Uncharacterized protein n=1 Tax=Aphanothece hegewaldii CCALA 016 TaxID=2107694 RepID=A0A2T1LU44_9CHRO|nr:hypothetical protein C7H19_18330 [Aphanothece hegewaldii CCALA 016]
MADVEPQMRQFHEKIKLKRFKESQVLCKKRERVLNYFDSGLSKLFEDKNLTLLTYKTVLTDGLRAKKIYKIATTASAK